MRNNLSIFSATNPFIMKTFLLLLCVVPAVLCAQLSETIKIDSSAVKKCATYGNNDSTGKYALVNGIKLYYEEYGSGAPLLLLHGNAQSISAFKWQIPELSKHYHVIAVDSRGQGKSTDDDKKFTYSLFAEDMNALLDHLHIDSANVVGCDDGGNTGLVMAMKYPAKVKKLVTMGVHVYMDEHVIEPWPQMELYTMIKKLQRDNTASAKKRLRITNLWLTDALQTFDELKSIQCPVLVMAGEHDLVVSGHTEEIASYIPKSTLLIAPKETHNYPQENAAGFNKTVVEFLRQP